MLLYLVRHGQSEGNVATYDVPDGNLTPLGRMQADEVARRLEPEGIDLLIASPLRRALQTADALRRRTACQLEVWRDLSEHRGLPAYRFLGKAGVRELCPGAVCEEDLPDDGYDLGLETVGDVHERAVRALGRLCQRYAETDAKIAVFAHAGFNSIFLSALAGRPVGPGFSIEQANCCVNRVRIEPDRMRLISVNETCHLTQIS